MRWEKWTEVGQEGPCQTTMSNMQGGGGIGKVGRSHFGQGFLMYPLFVLLPPILKPRTLYR